MSNQIAYFRALSKRKNVKNKPDRLEVAIVDAAGKSQTFVLMVKVSQAKIKRRANGRVSLPAAFIDHQEEVFYDKPLDRTTVKIATEKYPGLRGVWNSGFMVHVQTKGGKTEGRAKQRYMLLQRNSVYSLLPPGGARIAGVQLRTQKQDLIRVVDLFSNVEAIPPPPIDAVQVKVPKQPKDQTVNAPAPVPVAKPEQIQSSHPSGPIQAGSLYRRLHGPGPGAGDCRQHSVGLEVQRLSAPLPMITGQALDHSSDTYALPMPEHHPNQQQFESVTQTTQTYASSSQQSQYAQSYTQQFELDTQAYVGSHQDAMVGMSGTPIPPIPAFTSLWAIDIGDPLPALNDWVGQMSPMPALEQDVFSTCPKMSPVGSFPLPNSLESFELPLPVTPLTLDDLNTEGEADIDEPPSRKRKKKRRAYRLTPKQWNVKRHMPPFRATITSSKRWPDKRRVAVRFAGATLPANSVAVSKKSALVDIPCLPRMLAPGQQLKVALELFDMDTLLWSTSFLYTGGLADGTRGEDGEDSSSSDDSDDEDDTHRQQDEEKAHVKRRKAAPVQLITSFPSLPAFSGFYGCPQLQAGLQSWLQKYLQGECGNDAEVIRAHWKEVVNKNDNDAYSVFLRKAAKDISDWTTCNGDVRKADRHGFYWIHYVCALGFEDLVTQTVKAGADVNAVGKNIPLTPLLLAKQRQWSSQPRVTARTQAPICKLEAVITPMTCRQQNTQCPLQSLNLSHTLSRNNAKRSETGHTQTRQPQGNAVTVGALGGVHGHPGEPGVEERLCAPCDVKLSPVGAGASEDNQFSQSEILDAPSAIVQLLLNAGAATSVPTDGNVLQVWGSCPPKLRPNVKLHSPEVKLQAMVDIANKWFEVQFARVDLIFRWQSRACGQEVHMWRQSYKEAQQSKRPHEVALVALQFRQAQARLQRDMSSLRQREAAEIERVKRLYLLQQQQLLSFGALGLHRLPWRGIAEWQAKVKAEATNLEAWALQAQTTSDYALLPPTVETVESALARNQSQTECQVDVQMDLGARTPHLGLKSKRTKNTKNAAHTISHKQHLWKHVSKQISNLTLDEQMPTPQSSPLKSVGGSVALSLDAMFGVHAMPGQGSIPIISTAPPDPSGSASASASCVDSDSCDGSESGDEDCEEDDEEAAGVSTPRYRSLVAKNTRFRNEDVGDNTTLDISEAQFAESKPPLPVPPQAVHRTLPDMAALDALADVAVRGERELLQRGVRVLLVQQSMSCRVSSDLRTLHWVSAARVVHCTPIANICRLAAGSGSSAFALLVRNPADRMPRWCVTDLDASDGDQLGSREAVRSWLAALARLAQRGRDSH